jgi:hypothetical protein
MNSCEQLLCSMLEGCCAKYQLQHALCIRPWMPMQLNTRTGIRLEVASWRTFGWRRQVIREHEGSVRIGVEACNMHVMQELQCSAARYEG